MWASDPGFCTILRMTVKAEILCFHPAYTHKSSFEINGSDLAILTPASTPFQVRPKLIWPYFGDTSPYLDMSSLTQASSTLVPSNGYHGCSHTLAVGRGSLLSVGLHAGIDQEAAEWSRHRPGDSWMIWASSIYHVAEEIDHHDLHDWSVTLLDETQNHK